MNFLRSLFFIALICSSVCEEDPSIIENCGQFSKGIFDATFVGQAIHLKECFDLDSHKEQCSSISSIVLGIKDSPSLESLKNLGAALSNEANSIFNEYNECWGNQYKSMTKSAEVTMLYKVVTYLSFMSPTVGFTFNMLSNKDYLYQQLVRSREHIKNGKQYKAGRKVGKVLRRILFGAFVPT